MRAPAAVLVMLFAVFSGPTTLHGQDPDRLRLHGYVREAGTREPIVLALVRPSGAVPSLTDRRGYFVTQAVAAPVEVRVEAYGYLPLDTVLTTDSGVLELMLVPVAVALSPLEVRVRAARSAEDMPGPTLLLLGQEDLTRVPAALQADPLRALQAVPGVVAATPVSTRLLVRGGGPDQNQFLLDGFPILYPYHLAGAFSSFHMEAIQDVAFWMGSPPARYGGHLSSVVDLALRQGNRERVQGNLLLGPVTTGGAVEGPLPMGAWMVAARRTYVDALARIPGTRYPYHFWDTTSKVHMDLTPADRLTLVGFYGRDRLQPRPANELHTDPDQYEDEEFAWVNGMVGLSWRHLFGATAVYEQRVSRSVFTQRLAGAPGGQATGGVVGSNNTVELWSVRGVLEVSEARGHALEMGYEVSRVDQGHRTAYHTNLLGLPETRVHEAERTIDQFAGYVEDAVTLGPTALRLGVRAERVDGVSSLQPRLASAVRLGDALTLHAWGGRVRQYDHVLQDPDLDLTSLYSVDIWLPSGEAVKAGTADHAGLGAELDLPHGLGLRADLYAKQLRDLFDIPEATGGDWSVAIERLEPVDGRVTGLDLLFRRAAAEGLSGWFGYSYLRAITVAAEAIYPMSRQPRHRLVSVLDFTHGSWRIDTRFEAFEGLPYTPAVGSFSSRPYDFGYRGFTPMCQATRVDFLYGPTNSARTGWGRRLDVGAHRQWETRRGWQWELGLALYNALFDPPGLFRPRAPSFFSEDGCLSPVAVGREPELVLPAIPSITVRLRF